MAKLTFGQKAIQHVINQGRIEVGIANTIKDASDSEKLNAAIAGADTIHAAVELFKTTGKAIPIAGAVINSVDIYNWDSNTTTLDKITTFTGFIGSIVMVFNPVSALALGTIALSLSIYALAAGDDEQISSAVDSMLDTVGNAINDVWSDATSLLDYADNEAQTPVEKLQSLNNQINDGSIQFVKDGDTLSQIAQDNGLSLNELLALNPKYKANPDDVKAGALLILKDNAGTQSLSDYLKEHADDPQAVSALIDSLKTELQAASVILPTHS
ncbi:hypothetical protein BSPWISOXPB_10156 [uncultured Gammaproteobacteria bacterium]|nr:hypothetical protein BSPWISOXPB_10156 [uncultured Gammaproteobacteria bacterium]